MNWHVHDVYVINLAKKNEILYESQENVHMIRFIHTVKIFGYSVITCTCILVQLSVKQP